MANDRFPISTSSQGEYRADVTRDTWNPLDGFRRVIAQQGRPVLDADLNEQTAILLHYLECLAQDLGGPHFGRGDGFALGAVLDANQQLSDVSIRLGRYYVQGLLCENPSDTTYSGQPYALKPAAWKLEQGKQYVLYLDAWEEHLSALHRPYIREVALGGPDTATRSRVVWQLRIGALPKPADGADPDVSKVDAFYKQFSDQLQNDQLRRPGRTLLRARVNPGASDTNSPCVSSPTSQYRGPENQLYRVELQTTDEDGQPLFKWSRENSSVLFAVADGDPANKTLKLAQGWRDERFGLRAMDWIELVDDGERLQAPRPLLQISDVDSETLTISFGEAVDVTLKRIQEGHIYLRRWDQRSTTGLVEGHFAANKDDAWIDLEAGVQVQFSLKDFAQVDSKLVNFQPGDYWLIPARVSTGKVEWPTDANDSELPLPPHGVVHRYAPLALLRPAPQGNSWDLLDARNLRT